MVRSKGLNYRILAVIPGPTIPGNMRPYFMKTALAFRHYGLTNGISLKVC